MHVTAPTPRALRSGRSSGAQTSPHPVPTSRLPRVWGALNAEDALRDVATRMHAGIGVYLPDGAPLFELDVDTAHRRDLTRRFVHPVSLGDRLAATVVGYAHPHDRHHDRSLDAACHGIAAVMTDVVQRELDLDDMTTELLIRLEEVALLSHLGSQLSSLLDERAICDIGLDAALAALSAQRGFVAVEAIGGDDLIVITHKGFERFETTTITRGSGVSGHAAEWGNVVNLYQEESWGDARNGSRREAVLAVPFSRFRTSGERRAFGVLTLIGHRSGGRFGASEENLATTIAGYLGTSLHNCRLVKTAQTAARVERELELAAEIQASLLPDSPPQVSGYDLAARCVAAATVGGDCFDYFDNGAGLVALMIADVAGHSIGSAMMMGHARNALRWGLKQGAAPDAALEAANSMTSSDVAAAGLFITVQCCTVEPATGSLTLASGGHNPAALVRSDGSVEWLDADGFPFGFLDDATYDVLAAQLHAGDMVVLYTDGVVESRNPDGELFGDDRFAALLADLRGRTAHEVVSGIYDGLDTFSHGAPQLDDITIVVLSRLHPEEGS